jgi:hypothetical protein
MFRSTAAGITNRIDQHDDRNCLVTDIASVLAILHEARIWSVLLMLGNRDLRTQVSRTGQSRETDIVSLKTGQVFESLVPVSRIQ